MEASLAKDFMTRKIRCIIVKPQQICSYRTCNFYQSLDSCANQCQKTKKVGKRCLKCCSFEWSKKEQRCRLHTSCPTDAPRNKDFLTCRKEGQSLFPKQLFYLNWRGSVNSTYPIEPFCHPSVCCLRGDVHCPTMSLDIGHCPTNS